MALDMYNNFIDLSWWVNVVVFALLLNLVAAYIKSFIDALLAKVSDSYRKRIEEQTNYYDNLRKQAEVDQDFQIRITLEHMRLKTGLHISSLSEWYAYTCLRRWHRNMLLKDLAS